MSRYPRPPTNLTPGLIGWEPPSPSSLELLYLAWGLRQYHQLPPALNRHDGWIYWFIRHGSPSFLHPKGQRRLQAGDLLMVGPEFPCGWGDTAGKRCRILTWMWRRAPSCIGLEVPPDSYRVFALGPKADSALAAIHAQCRTEVSAPDSYTPLALQELHLRLDLWLARGLQPRPREPQAALRIELAARWLHEHPDALQPVTALCDYFRVSQATLRRMFHSQLGQSPLDCIQRARMERARGWLREETLTVKEAAGRLGYRHPNDFSRAYARFWGRPPTAERHHHPTPSPPCPERPSHVSRIPEGRMRITSRLCT